MDKQIEAVARAICAADAHDWDRLNQYPYHALEQQHMYKQLAKAAIAALREQQAERSTLIRYGIRWDGPTNPICEPMPDGYWTPWHLAQEAVSAPQPDVELLRRVRELLPRVREHVAGDIETPNESEAEYVQNARELVAEIDTALALLAPERTHKAADAPVVGAEAHGEESSNA